MPQVPFPRVMTAPFAVLATVAVDDVFQLLPLDCLGARPSYFEALVALTLLPVLAAVFLTVVHFARLRYSRSSRLTGQEKRATCPTSKAPLSAVFHSFRLIFGRAIISWNGLEAWMLISGTRARGTLTLKRT